MSGKGTGGTSFEDMSHEQMLAWLDQANAGTVQAAATRLTAAAKEIRKIAEELKVRPQWVEWKGEGADAFRAWTGDLANSTLRLGDFSEDSATWLGHASDAIATAQASIPRDKAGAQANLDAATAAHNDPDAAAVSSKSTTELAALAANKEKVRQEAAAQMTKLGQAYQLSATQLDGLERPTFPPPPVQLQPKAPRVWENEVVSTGGGAADMASSRHAVATSSPSSGSQKTVAEVTGGGARGDGEPDERRTVEHSLPEVADHVGVKIDGTQVLPQTPSSHPVSPAGPPIGGTDGGGTLPAGTVRPMLGGVPGSPVGPTKPGRAMIGGRPSSQPGRAPAGPDSRSVRSVGGAAEPGSPTGTARPTIGGRPAVPPGRGIAGTPPGRVPGSNGIVGGRPTSPAAGRPTRGLSRGTVVGGETPSAPGRGTSGQKPPTGAGGAGSGQRATPADRRSTGTGSGSGVVGGRPQQQKRLGTRPFTRGGSGLVRNQDSDGATPTSSAAGRTSAPPNGSRASNATRRKNEQDRGADRRTEEQETGKRNGHSTTEPPASDRPCT
ncbi:translation initiation factor IF-2 [Streptomyces sp. NPDC096311]|uniref:translation initiation factor IF-2 n=1 Tax=Streptomyces sp. NPDC096311 TaxID=3366083 RepID=UPI00381C77E5